MMRRSGEFIGRMVSLKRRGVCYEECWLTMFEGTADPDLSRTDVPIMIEIISLADISE